ncbi:portal protein, partial [Solidesulfovibrio sp.]
ELSAPDGMVEVANGRIGHVIIRDQPQLAEWQVRLMQDNEKQIQDVAGVTDENMGRDTNAKSGKAIHARQQQGHVVTAGIFDNLRLAVQMSGELQLSLIEQFYDTAKTVRILGNDAKSMEFLELNVRGEDGVMMNPITASVADFVVDEEDFNQSTRQAMFDSLMQAAQSMPPEIGAQLLPTALSLSDLPQRDEIIAKVNRALGLDEEGNPIQRQGADPAAQQAAQMDAALAAAQIKKIEAETELTLQRAATEQTEQTVRIEGMNYDQQALDLKRVQTVAGVASGHARNQLSAAKRQASRRLGIRCRDCGRTTRIPGRATRSRNRSRKMEGYTPEELAAAGLSPEEIAAMTDDAPAEGLPVDAEAQPGIPPVTTPEGEGGAPAPVAAPEVPPVAPVEGEAPTLPAEGDEPAMPAEVPPVDGEKAPVQDKTALPSDPFAAKMVGPQMTPEDYKAALADLRAKAQSGEIDSLDYADAVADLKAQVAVATFAQQNNAATDSQKWAYAKEAFRTVHPEYANPAMRALSTAW